MNESALEGRRAEQVIRETSEERVWETPGYLVVENALGVTAYALGDRPSLVAEPAPAGPHPALTA
ncbi:pyrroloquinoline quinone precursor peptide PqqA [Streptomyces sp. NPDC090798]|uniref:pyrroloquinoline quinone precursor peptide PqqA n=1 Tax=Streptomyces sp. NPDC090798 TaxID=3365968 RepID=UPI00382DA936